LGEPYNIEIPNSFRVRIRSDAQIIAMITNTNEAMIGLFLLIKNLIAKFKSNNIGAHSDARNMIILGPTNCSFV
jgi:hypothetical protein